MEAVTALLSVIFLVHHLHADSAPLSPMQGIAHKATFKAAAGCFSLLLSAQHNLHFPLLQHDTIPNNFHAQVTAQNPLHFTLSGSKNGILATHDELVTSKTTNYLLQLLRKVLSPWHSIRLLDSHTCLIE